MIYGVKSVDGCDILINFANINVIKIRELDNEIDLKIWCVGDGEVESIWVQLDYKEYDRFKSLILMYNRK